jgi:RHS repeat-associated protein
VDGGTPTISYYHSDHLGSSSVITDQSGQQVAHYEYSPYGAITVNELANGQTGQPANYYFTGKELDATGLYFYGARYYDPEIGRFITADTIVQAPYDPQSLNRYAYCRNNPLNYVDPSGHWFWFALIIGALIGGATSAAMGGNIGLGILTGAIGGVLFGGAGQIARILELSRLATAGLYAVAGAVSGAAGAGITGGNVGIGALTGAIGGALGYGASLIGGPLGLLAGLAAGAVGGGIGSVMLGGEFGDGAWRGAASAGISYAVSTAARMMSQKPKTEAEKQDQQREAPRLQEKQDNGQAEGGAEGKIKAAAEVAQRFIGIVDDGAPSNSWINSKLGIDTSSKSFSPALFVGHLLASATAVLPSYVIAFKVSNAAPFPANIIADACILASMTTLVVHAYKQAWVPIYGEASSSYPVIKADNSYPVIRSAK